jgi:hypothetical protein
VLHTPFRSPVKHPSRISASQNTIPMVQPVNMETVNNLKTYYVKMVNYILGANKENLVTSSTDREVGTRINI